MLLDPTNTPPFPQVRGPSNAESKQVIADPPDSFYVLEEIAVEATVIFDTQLIVYLAKFWDHRRRRTGRFLLVCRRRREGCRGLAGAIVVIQQAAEPPARSPRLLRVRDAASAAASRSPVPRTLILLIPIGLPRIQ